MSDSLNSGLESGRRDDPFARQLARLAPTVDTAASRALFERSRGGTSAGGDGPRRWLAAAAIALVIGGVVGLWALGRDGTTTPASETDEPAEEPADDESGASPVTDGVVEPGQGFEVHFVAESPEPYGRSWLVNDLDDPDYEALMRAHPVVPEPDLGRSVVLATIRPDNACPDTLVRFEVESNVEGVPVWTPVFEEQAAACEDPLLSWLYVVAIDRAVLGDEAIIRIPSDEMYGVEEQLLRYVAAGTADQAAAVEDPGVVVEPTGIIVPKPAPGEPAIHNTSAGLVWVVSHDDGSVSVLPAAIEAPTSEDAGAVTGLSALVIASDSGETFTGGQYGWDAWGRATNGGRANDLVGYGGRVDGDEVEIVTSTATRVPGDPIPPPGDESYELPDLGEPIDVPTFYTLSSSGPIWRYLDATLVVEDGVGRICEVDTTVPVDRVATCADAGFVLDTSVTSTQPEIATWFAAPILAFQDPLRQFTRVIPLGGRMSLNTAADGSATTVAEPFTSELEASAEEPAPCWAEPSPPPFLPSGAEVGTPTITQRGDASTAWWGTQGEPDAVGQSLDASLDDYPMAEDSRQHVTTGTSSIDVVPVGDPPVGMIGLELVDSDGCLTEYFIGPGISLDDAVDYATRWIAATADSMGTTGVLAEPPAGPVEFLAIGDTVMLGAGAELADRGYTVDAVVSRQLADVVPQVEALVADDLLIDTPVVVHLGANGPIDEDDLDDLLDALDGFQNVVLLTVHADRAWTEPNNELVRAAGSRSNVIVLDWAELADECGDACFASDGIHLSEAGVEFYTDQISEVVGR